MRERKRLRQFFCGKTRRKTIRRTTPGVVGGRGWGAYVTSRADFRKKKSATRDRRECALKIFDERWCNRGKTIEFRRLVFYFSFSRFSQVIINSYTEYIIIHYTVTVAHYIYKVLIQSVLNYQSGNLLHGSFGTFFIVPIYKKKKKKSNTDNKTSHEQQSHRRCYCA